MLFLSSKQKPLGLFAIYKNTVAALFISILLFGFTASAANNTTLNFKNADIRNVIEAVSKATGKNFLIDPRVSGKVTMISSSEMDESTLYGTFLAILKVHGFIAVDAGNNLVKILPATESRSEANIKSTGSDTPKDEVLMEIIEIEHVSAIQLIPILRPLVSKNGHLAAHGDSNNIIVSDTRANIDKLRSIIAKIDNANESELKVVKLRHADATNLVGILKSMSGSGKKGKKGSSSKSSLVAEERTNSILIRGSKSQINSMMALIKKLDVSTSQRSGVSVVRLGHSKAKDIEAVLNKMLSGGGGDKKDAIISSDGDVQISMDEKANAIVVVGPPNAVSEMTSIIRKLDIKRTQILVEALIVEMTASKSTQLGLLWSGAVGGTKQGSTGGGIGNIIGSIRAGNAVSFSVLAEALATDADANLVSAPSIITIENEEAEIEIGREVPFITGSYTSTGEGGSGNPGNPFQTITRSNVGLKLKITPQINKNNIIKLAIEQEISNIIPGGKTAAGAADVVTSKRSINTNVLVKNGHMLVLGGLIDDSVRESATGTPGLRKIPLLGHLFNLKGTEKEKRNLMVFIRPLIIDANLGQHKITANRYNYMRNLQLQRAKRGVALMPKAKQPVVRNLYPSNTVTTPRTYKTTTPPQYTQRQAPVSQKTTAQKKRRGPLGSVGNWFKRNNQRYKAQHNKPYDLLEGS